MITFYITPFVEESIEKYLKKDEYANCEKDLSFFFDGLPIEQIAELPILISPSPDFKFIKSRIANSCTNKGKSAGYRLYYYVQVSTERVYLIGYYPKTGKFGREDLTDTELKILIKQFAEYKAKKALKEYRLDKSMQTTVVEKETIIKETITLEVTTPKP